MRGEFEEVWTKVRIVLDFRKVLLDVGGRDASFESGKGHSLFGVDRAACGHVAKCLSLIVC